MKRAVLFVDDNPVTLKSIEIAFANEPCQVLLAQSGAEGLAIVKREHPGVIVSDLRMPGMNGLEFLRTARSIYDNWIGMIFSAYQDITSVTQAVKEECVWRYITKPWADSRELVIAVNNAMQYLEAREARRHAEEILARTKHLAGIGQLAAGIAHQFNNINVCIIGYAQMAKFKENLSPELNEYFEKITRAARRATEIINDLLNFSNYSSKRFAPYDLSLVVRDSLALLQKDLEREEAKVETNLVPTSKVDVDYGLIRLLVCHLVNNAWQATVGGYDRTIHLETGEKGDRVYVTVRDRGCGITPANLPKIFDPFFSTKGVHAEPDSPEASLPGVGLGLSMSHTIAESHGGELTVKSVPGQGAAFTLFLPK